MDVGVPGSHPCGLPLGPTLVHPSWHLFQQGRWGLPKNTRALHANGAHLGHLQHFNKQRVGEDLALQISGVAAREAERAKEVLCTHKQRRIPDLGHLCPHYGQGCVWACTKQGPTVPR